MILVIIFYGCMFFIGFIANGLLGLKFFCEQGTRTSNAFLYGLIVADMLVCSVSGPSTLIVLGDRHSLSQWALIITNFVQSWPVSASNFSMMALSINRYMTLKNFAPLNERKRKLLTTVSLGLIWACAFVLTCIDMVHKEDARPAFKWIKIGLGYFLPTVLVLTCYAMVYFKLTTLSLTVRASCGEVPLPMPVFRIKDDLLFISGLTGQVEEETPIKNELVDVEEDISLRRRTTLKNRTRLANSMCLMAIAFLVSWFPYIACQFFLQMKLHPFVDLQYTLMFGQLHSAINPMIYWSFNRKWPKFNFSKLNLTLPNFQIPRSASSTNEAALGPFNPRLIRPRRGSLDDSKLGKINDDDSVIHEPLTGIRKNTKPSTPKPRKIKAGRFAPIRDRPPLVKSHSSDIFY